MIIDAPPVPLGDMQVLASMADLLAYVIKASMTGRDVVQKALKVIGETANVGITLNGLDAHATPYYMQQEYYREAHHEQPSKPGQNRLSERTWSAAFGFSIGKLPKLTRRVLILGVGPLARSISNAAVEANWFHASGWISR